MLLGFLSYVLMSTAGLAVTTATYAGLAWSLARFSVLPEGAAVSVFLTRMACQFVAILLGTYFNYELNKTFTWSDFIPSVGRLTK